MKPTTPSFDAMAGRPRRHLFALTLGALACVMLALPAAAADKARAALTVEAEQALWRGDFDYLDRENEILKHGKHLAPDAASELEFFRAGLDSTIATGVERREPYLRELEALTLQWATEHPTSSLAHVLYAKVLVAHAWSYRGGGYASDVPPEAWKDFRNYLERAAKYLEGHADVALTDSSAHVLLMQIGNGLDWDVRQLDAIQRDGLKRNPDDVTLYFAMVTPLLPKWHGNARILDAYIRRATEETRADYGMGMYARLYAGAADLEFGHALFENSLADWPTMKKGYEDMMARFPDSPDRLNGYAHMACLAKDRPTLVKLLGQIGDKINAAQWGPNSERSVEGCQRWAKATGDGPDAPPRSPRATPSGI